MHAQWLINSVSRLSSVNTTDPSRPIPIGNPSKRRDAVMTSIENSGLIENTDSDRG